MADPYLSHILSRLHTDLDFLASTSNLSPTDLSTIKSLLPSSPSTSASTVPPRRLSTPATTSPTASTRQQSLGSGGILKRAVPPPPPRPGATGGTVHVPQREVEEEEEVKRCRATWDYGLNQPDDLPFTKGDIIEILEETNSDWWRGSCNGRTGIFPSNHVERIESITRSASGTSPTSTMPAFIPSPPLQYPDEKSYLSEKQPLSPSSSYQQPTQQPQQQFRAPPPPIPPKRGLFGGGGGGNGGGGRFAKQMGTSFASGVGFGVGVGVAEEAIQAIF